MRELARYVLESESGDPAAAWQRTVAVVESWLGGKGYSGSADFILPNGRTATLGRMEVSCSVGTLVTWKLLEEIDGGFFETRLETAKSDRDLRVACTISAGHGSNRIAPLPVDARCPSVIGRLLESDAWFLGPTPLAKAPLAVNGAAGGRTLVQVLTQPVRTLPVLVISTHFGLVLHTDLPARIARDLTGLALVCVADDEASWHLTSTFGKSLSCFSGAIRLYWPGFKPSDSVFQHPLWTAQRLLDRTSDIDTAVQSICGTLRRRLMAVSVAALAEPPIIMRIRHTEADERAAASRKQMSDHSDYRSLADSYAAENTGLRGDVDRLEGDLAALRGQLYRLRTEAAWADAPEDLLPESTVPPATVEEAVDRARTLFASTLTVGADVQRGVAELAPQAGPPDKVFGYLKKLSELADARRSGPLGKSPVQWLSEQNVEVSTESETVTQNRAEMLRRTWHDGIGRRPFDMHLKPKESTHPDQCVRIYFDWDEPSRQVVVGWVGRHP